MTLLAKNPCGRCGWKYKGKFHICLDRNDPSIRIVRDFAPGNRRTGPHTSMAIQNMSMAQIERRDREFLRHTERNDKIVDMWNEGFGSYTIAKALGISKDASARYLRLLSNMGRIEDYEPGRRRASAS